MVKTNNEKTKDYSNKKPYNNIPCLEGQVLTPVVLSESMKEILMCSGLDLRNVETWKTSHSGLKYPVVFLQMSPEDAKKYEPIFNSDVRTYVEEKYHLNKSNTVSLDKLIDALYDNDATGFDPTGTNSFEESYKYEMMLKDLIDDFNKQDKNKGKVISLITQGYNRQETGEQLDLKVQTNQRFVFIRKTLAEAMLIIEEKYM